MIGPRENIRREPFLGLAVESVEFNRKIGDTLYNFTRDLFPSGGVTVVVINVEQNELVHRFEGKVDSRVIHQVAEQYSERTDEILMEAAVHNDFH